LLSAVPEDKGIEPSTLLPRQLRMSTAAKPISTPGHRRGDLLVLAATCAASFCLYLRWMVHPYLAVDDFQIVVRSWTWQRTWAELWVPANEHAMPLGRLTTWILVQLAGRASAVPQLAAMQGPLAIVLGAVLLFVLVRRELAHPFYGLVAAALFGVSTVYEQAVYWFSASFSVLTLDTLLLGLLAAQSWRLSRRLVWLLLCGLAAALAPAWFASGILAGPLCALYLLPDGSRRGESRLRTLAAALVPLLGTGLFLIVSLPRTADAIMHLPHYGGTSALDSFQPLPGVKYTVWSIVENLLLGSVGISSVTVPFGIVLAVWPILITAGVWWWLGAPSGRRLIITGVGLIFTSYLLTYSARALWMNDRNLSQPLWSRYHLLPQLGLALVVAGGLPRWGPQAGSTLTRRQIGMLVGLVVGLFVIQLPRALWTDSDVGDEQWQAQQVVLRRIDAVDALCRAHRIGRATAREALGKLDVPGCLDREDGWAMLWGSPNPDPSISVSQARRLLSPAAGTSAADSSD
jgi:hypothetical protein